MYLFYFIKNFEIETSVELNINRKIDECLRENDYINRILVLDFNFLNPLSIYCFSDYLIIKQEKTIFKFSIRY